jgi:hypothetical protein
MLFAQVKGVEHVIIFGIDALSTDGVECANTPALDYIMQNGSYSMHVRGVMPTVSAPNWSSMLMGAGPEQTGITSNSWDPNDPPFPPVTGRGNHFPTVFTVLKEQRPNATTSAFYDWDKFDVLLEDQDVDVRGSVKYQFDGFKLELDDLQKRKTTLSFYYTTYVDDIGHGIGHGTKEYYESITQIDSLLGVLLNYLKETGLDKSTLVLVISDHGGIGHGHGGESLAEIQVPVFLYGAGVTKGKEITEAVNNYDVAATAAYALGLKQPQAWVGRPILSAFEKADKKSEGVVKTPFIYPNGGLFYSKSNPISFKSYSNDADIYYTTDGSEPTANSMKYSAPFVVNKTSLVKAKAVNKNGVWSKTRTVSVRVINSSNSSNGVNYKYYEGEWTKLPDFSGLAPVSSGRTYEFSLDSIKHRPDHFAVRYEGSINIPNDGEYKFTCASDDGVKLYIDGQLVVNNDGSHSLSYRTGKVKLDAKKHKIVLEYFDDTDDQSVTVYWEGPGIQMQALSPEYLN